MAYLKFLDSENIYKTKVIPSGNIVTLKFDSDKEVSTAGFDLFLDESCEVDIGGDFYLDYTTIYRNDDVTAEYNGYQLSNDGSVYVEPEPVPEPEPYEPTLEDLKQAKIQEVSSACKQTIHAGVDVELPTGSTEHFSLKEEDQINLFGKQAQITAGITQLEYHQDGRPCRYYTVGEMTAIITAAMQFVSYHTTYCNSLYTWINAAANKEDLQEITYGVSIPVEYQSEVLQTYLLSMRGDKA